jgi:uncharacterized membrane protein YtjA (UPF0391 family)
MGVLGWTGLGAGAAVAAGVAYVVLKRRPEKRRRV